MKKIIYLSILTILLYGCSNSPSTSTPTSVFGVYQTDGNNQSRIYLYPDSTYIELEPTFKVTQTEFDGTKTGWEYIYSEDKILTKGKINVEDRGDFYVLQFIFTPKNDLYKGLKIDPVNQKLAKDFSSYYYTNPRNNQKKFNKKISGEDGLIKR